MSDKETAPLLNWTQKAALEYLRQAHPDLITVMVEELAGIIAKWHAGECTAPAPQRGDSIVGRTDDEPHRPLVCYVCVKRFPVTFNFCLEHKDEYERLKAAATPRASPTPDKCPTCGSNQQSSFWRGCREKSTIPDSWHSSAATQKGSTKD